MANKGFLPPLHYQDQHDHQRARDNGQRSCGTNSDHGPQILWTMDYQPVNAHRVRVKAPDYASEANTAGGVRQSELCLGLLGLSRLPLIARIGMPGPSAELEAPHLLPMQPFDGAHVLSRGSALRERRVALNAASPY